jgi:TPR repeat protein
MNFRQALLVSTSILILGCGEDNAPNRSSYQPTSRPKANVSPSGNNSSPAVTPTPTAWTPSVIDTQVKASPSPPKAVTTKEVEASGASTTPTINKTVDEIDSPTNPEPEYTTLPVADLQKLADKGDPQASWILGLRFEAGNGVATNAVTAYQLVTMAAVRSKGVHRSLILKDRERIKPMLTTIQIEQAAKPADDFLTKQVEMQIAEATKGDAEMQYMLGVWFLHGEGVPSDKQKAVKLLAPAAEQGHVGASALLGRMYLSGDTVTKDMVKGYRLLEHAAQKGSEWARAEISAWPNTMTPTQLAEASETARKFLAKKVVLLEAAAEKGAAAEQFKLGLMYYLGTEIFKDLDKAAQWFQKAGEQGHAEATALLAGMHFSGEGLEKSFVQAYKWYAISKARGNSAATANQTEVAKLLTPEEKAGTDKEVTAWLAAHPKKK